MIQLQRILLPTDFSETAAAARSYGLDLARAFGAVLHVLHVIEPPVYYNSAFGGYVPDPETLESYAKAGLDNWIPEGDGAGLTVTTEFVTGTPFVEIVSAAKRHACDLVVIGTHGRGALAHALIGSVAERVVRKAPCPVLTVRLGTHRFVMP
jgi:nucleotide-binding universal stress UspA family protein